MLFFWSVRVSFLFLVGLILLRLVLLRRCFFRILIGFMFVLLLLFVMFIFVRLLVLVVFVVFMVVLRIVVCVFFIMLRFLVVLIVRLCRFLRRFRFLSRMRRRVVVVLCNRVSVILIVSLFDFLSCLYFVNVCKCRYCLDCCWGWGWGGWGWWVNVVFFNSCFIY